MGVVGLRSTPKGQFGNRLFNYIVIRELAQELGVGYFSHNRLDRRLIRGIHRLPFPPLKYRNTVLLEREYVEADDFLDRAKNWVEQGRVIVPKPRLLANAYARFDFLPPRTFIRHRFSLCQAHRRATREPSVVVHLRGNDFATWKGGAILGEDYYRNALDYLSDYGHSSSPVRLCTDDDNHPALDGLRSLVRDQDRLITVDGCSNPFVCDFAALMSASVVVSSPSTFAITAGLLGRQLGNPQQKLGGRANR